MGNSKSRAKATKSITNGHSIEQTQMEAEQSLAALALLKERRRGELLAFEEQQAKRMAEEAQLKNTSDANRDKFLSHLMETEKHLGSQIAEIQQQQEISRQKFSEQLCKTESEMDASIKDVLKDIRAHRDQTQLQELVKLEESQSQTILTLKMEEFKSLRKADILNAMKKQLEQDITSQTITNTNQTLFTAVTLEDEVKNRQIEEILQHRQKDQAALVMSLLKEESWQLQAFSSLLNRRDRRTAQLNEDIRTVVDQLNQLTNWELQRKIRKFEITNNVLEENRRLLAELLSQLIEQQVQRRKDLKELLQEMEQQRRNQAADYWLVQYQRLMDNMPEAVQQYLPSAPSSIAEATAPPFDVFEEIQCVICLDISCQVIFLPCGHLCCCTTCGEAVCQCPMCRTLISQRLQVNA